ncbi:hypothetical protein K438DRAFT_1748283 [Mycena galopus ATCC 62051]|nr:hypothetical protein K438DRAFT_1748283 [Mycena galopus ATCC 62051]
MFALPVTKQREEKSEENYISSSATGETRRNPHRSDQPKLGIWAIDENYQKTRPLLAVFHAAKLTCLLPAPLEIRGRQVPGVPGGPFLYGSSRTDYWNLAGLAMRSNTDQSTLDRYNFSPSPHRRRLSYYYLLYGHGEGLEAVCFSRSFGVLKQSSSGNSAWSQRRYNVEADFDGGAVFHHFLPVLRPNIWSRD